MCGRKGEDSDASDHVSHPFDQPGALPDQNRPDGGGDGGVGGSGDDDGGGDGVVVVGDSSGGVGGVISGG